MQQYWGKIISVALALMVGTGIRGIILSLIIGYFLDRMIHNQKIFRFSNQQKCQELFFDTTFEVMGHLSKSKGRVTETDIHIASQLMDRMKLRGESRIEAQNSFRIGKSDNYPLRERMRQFCNVCFGRFDLIRMFLEIQIQAAFSDGSLHPNEREILYVIAEELGIFRAQFDQFLSMIQGSTQFSGNYQKQFYSGKNQNIYRRQPTLKDAYNVLGVKSTDNFSTIKRAYRKLMNEHHPDKLVAKGLPPEMMEIAKQKVQEIQRAYEMIKNHKNLTNN